MTTSRRAFGVMAAGAALTAALPGAASAASRHRRGRPFAHDDFRHGLGAWAVELESGGSVTAARGVLDIDVPGGATVWFKERLRGPYIIEYTATAVSAGGANDRVSDLNNFWNATDVRSPHDLFATTRGGTLAEYDYLTTYYVGYGANGNTTTRLRRYVGEAGVRPLVFDRTRPLLTPDEPQRVRIVSAGRKDQWWRDGELVFDYDDPAPYRNGYFAFRTVTSHFKITDFVVSRPSTYSGFTQN
ncbi:DUF6250 domain-containing protein [Streptomyces beijiangensis]|uniref:Tat pathway signal sequence domain protein n=1 Tax=Streptomyces beijiangensis TaxID=163361 RepID=A0A939F2W5_9ACTN|nr:DUF6250 domain-containing protein [Streptomyces beijiangensis]MBO0511551.1 Tat pathway signal sequence domain protein [Streptomyces beijiangensis]